MESTESQRWTPMKEANLEGTKLLSIRDEQAKDIRSQ